MNIDIFDGFSCQFFGYETFSKKLQKFKVFFRSFGFFNKLTWFTNYEMKFSDRQRLPIHRKITKRI